MAGRYRRLICLSHSITSSQFIKLSPTNMRVLISGAGIAGPTLAYFLGKIGVRVTVFEKAPGLLPYGQNIDVNGSALKVMQHMNLLRKLKEYNTTEKGTQFISPTGKIFAQMPVREGSRSFTAATEILRGDLSLICYEASLKFPSVKYCFDTTISRVIKNDDSGVQVETSNGDIQDFDLLVASDGQWSRVRKQTFSQDSIQVIDKGMVAIYFTIPRLPSDNSWWNIYHEINSRIITTRPDPHGTIRAMFTIMPTEDRKEIWARMARADRETKNKFLREEFSDAGWQTQRLLDEMEKSPDFYFHSIQQIKMTHWSEKRVICLGDTAYAPSPLTGAGANLALLGAYCLAGEISKLEPGKDLKSALDAYEKNFKPFVEETQHVPSVFPGCMHPSTPFRRWFFHCCISLISRVIALPFPHFLTPPKIDAEDFKLPSYPSLEEASGEKMVRDSVWLDRTEVVVSRL